MALHHFPHIVFLHKFHQTSLLVFLLLESADVHCKDVYKRQIYTHAQKNGYSVVEDIGGHGIGLEFHEEPFVSYVTPKGSEMVLVPGMMFTIEPMLNEGCLLYTSSSHTLHNIYLSKW